MMLGSNIRRVVVGLASAAAIAGLTIAPAGAATGTKSAPAPAPPAKPVAHGTSAIISSSHIRPLASQDGSCDVGEVCLYYFSNFAGSRYDTAHNDPTLFDNRFITAGAGQLATVGANAESVWNRDPNTTVWVCTGTNQTGSCGYVAPNSYGNFNSTYFNKVDSLIWADSSN
jgi:hypothetical protein